MLEHIPASVAVDVLSCNVSLAVLHEVFSDQVMTVPCGKVQRGILLVNGLLIDILALPDQAPDHIKVAVFASFPNIYQSHDQVSLTVEGLFDLVVLGDDEGSAALAIFNRWKLIGISLGLHKEVHGSWMSVVGSIM